MLLPRLSWRFSALLHTEASGPTGSGHAHVSLLLWFGSVNRQVSWWEKSGAYRCFGVRTWTCPDLPALSCKWFPGSGDGFCREIIEPSFVLESVKVCSKLQEGFGFRKLLKTCAAKSMFYNSILHVHHLAYIVVYSKSMLLSNDLLNIRTYVKKKLGCLH